MYSTRRSFLKVMGCLAAAGLQGTFDANGKEIDLSKERGYAILPWQGDNFARGHQLRDGKIPNTPPATEVNVDFVIIGGGMAGLACAHYLRDHNFVLLEQYGQTGGTSSGGTYRGIDYSMGAVCTGKHQDDLVEECFHELNLVPVLIPPAETAWHAETKWYKGLSGSSKFHRELNRLIAGIDRITAEHRKDGRDGATSRTAASSELDDALFSSYLGGYDSAFLSLINNTCKSFFCLPPEKISASAGIFMVRALTSDSYVCDGGNSGIARALTNSINARRSGRIKTSSFVWSVEPSQKGASVIYSDNDGHVHRINCRHAVIATPPLVAARILKKMPPGMLDAFHKLEYGSFVVANICMPRKVIQHPYQSFADAPYPFGQMVLAEAPYIARACYKPEMGSVLTLYCPYPADTAGRVRLMTAQREEVAHNMLTNLTGLLEPLQGKVEQVVLTRWGHAGISPKPGIGKILKSLNSSQTERITFAHSSASGAVSLEAALKSGRMAAERCLLATDQT